MKRARRYRITGLVQGVGFRAATKRRAEALGLVGWVANKTDGSVVVVTEGAADELKLFEDWLSEGPPGAVVRAVEAEEVEVAELEGFEVRKEGGTK